MDRGPRQSMGLQRARRDWANTPSLLLIIKIYWNKFSKWFPLAYRKALSSVAPTVQMSPPSETAPPPVQMFASLWTSPTTLCADQAWTLTHTSVRKSPPSHKRKPDWPGQFQGASEAVRWKTYVKVENGPVRVPKGRHLSLRPVSHSHILKFLLLILLNLICTWNVALIFLIAYFCNASVVIVLSYSTKQKNSEMQALLWW